MHHAKRVHCYIQQEQKQTHTVRLSHIISCLLYLFRVSDALGYTRNNSECFVFSNMSCCPLLPGLWLGEGDNDAKVLHFLEIRGMNVDFSLGKGCVG